MVLSGGRSTPPAQCWYALSAGFGLAAVEFVYVYLTMHVWWSLVIVGGAVVLAGACAAAGLDRG